MQYQEVIWSYRYNHFKINMSRHCHVGVLRIVSAEIYFDTFFLSRLIAG